MYFVIQILSTWSNNGKSSRKWTDYLVKLVWNSQNIKCHYSWHCAGWIMKVWLYLPLNSANVLEMPCCPTLSRKHWDIKSHSSVCPSVRLSVRLSIRLSVTKTLTLAIPFALLQVEPWYLACVFFVTRPFRWYHVVTLTVTFDLLQGQICCQAGDHNSLNLLVTVQIKRNS